MKTSAFVCALLFLTALSGFGALLLDEPFNYPDGALVLVSGGKWINHNGTTGEVEVISGAAKLSQSKTEDVNALLAGAPYAPTGSTNVFYAGFTVRFTSLPTSGGTYFAHFKDSGSGFRARIWAFTGSAAPGAFRLGLSSTSTSLNVTNATDLALNVDYQIVVRVVNSNSLATLWIAPQNESSPSVSTSDGVSSFTVNAFALRQNTSEGTLLIDNLKVGTTFADVVSPTIAPSITTQPQDQTVSEGETATFSVAADGTAPLFFQWQFNETNLAGANSSTLFLSDVKIANAGNYSVIVSNNAGSITSATATLTVIPQPVLEALTVLTYNTKGNGATNWSTNSPQVQAIGRQVQFLQPDIITFQEIPLQLSGEMTNFVAAFLPGYYLARNSGSDGFIRSVIVSRFPITRSTSWLSSADLKPYGYTNSGNSGNFTRDLFEAQINVPSFAQPLHVFTTHLKSSSSGYTDAAEKRAAEAAAITNFFATNFFVNYPNDPYYLAGDMNESDTNALVIQRLVSVGSGLRLTNPANPFTGKINTYSIQGSLSERIDYILPGDLLFSKITSSEVFRTDLLNPVPPGLFADDDKTASDHLPVLMTFANPYNNAFRIRSIVVSNQLLTLEWGTVNGRQYRIESSATLSNWTVFSPTLTASGTNLIFTTNVAGGAKFFRVVRQ